MKLHQQVDAGTQFKQYKDGAVQIGENWYSGVLIVTVDDVDQTWSATSFDSLTSADFEYLLKFKPEVVLLGTGPSFRFLNPALTLPLASQGVGVEAMDTGAMCRTFNILSGEGRKVVAAILP
ncbi:Mth938-like domain-containing protein [Leeia sp. TBRC 13508]|uniref:Mth938-like domain-containing protein n=1 Tax=Leeia speluncae TaxID=2884804 RepID=A0ABS8D6N8_9NEIS|nr:Mth938-like domain-containing protein [Leeia speluncae]MCB6183812.1 Mth938-like domain-containing protein [Leeia speluncae]